MKSGIDTVGKNALSFFATDGIYPKAIRIFTPFSEGVPLEKCKISPALEELLRTYEPKITTAGVFPHQAAFLKSLDATKNKNFIVTTATGSGKSLCFWAWVFEYLMRDPSATALLCFPTQALMWGQAERLTRMSESTTLSFPGNRDTTPYGGSITAKGRRLGWTVWHGLGRGYARNRDMEVHENSKEFELARIRIATLDKAHWSLNQGKRNQDFLSRLKCLVLDEAHVYDGVFGANVHYFLKRLWLSCNMLNRNSPNVFLASATLSSATSFAKMLLSLRSERDIIHIEDSTRQEIDLVYSKDVPRLLQNPPANGLLRIALLLDGLKTQTRLPRFMSSETLLGREVNAIYFSQSKYESKLLAMEMERRSSKRESLIYDADLPPLQRRALERKLNDPSVKGKTVLATNAMELGVDIEGLDVCFIDKVPPRRADMLQRIGRVGRRANRPGLILMRLGAEPLDQHILEAPLTAFRLDQTEHVPIPLHLEMLRWRCMLGAFSEWMGPMSKNRSLWPRFNSAMEKHFGEKPFHPDLKKIFEERYGSLVDTSDRAWVHKGFRATTSESKIPLMHGTTEIARVEDIAIFRDAHPEAVFLGHDLKRYRVTAYEGQWTVAKWEHPKSEEVLGKWLRTISAVRVVPEGRNVTTRGSWKDSFLLYEHVPKLSAHLVRPSKGNFEFGIWNYTRRWQGYSEVDLKTRKKRLVLLAEVARRFKQAIEQGARFPFLFDFSYRTWGWQWSNLPAVSGSIESRQSLSETVGAILTHFLAGAIESKVADLRVELDLNNNWLQVLDATPGGNGLSEALLAQNRMLSALKLCHDRISALTDDEDQFSKYVLNLCHIATSHAQSEVVDVVRTLRQHWAR